MLLTDWQFLQDVDAGPSNTAHILCSTPSEHERVDPTNLAQVDRFKIGMICLCVCVLVRVPIQRSWIRVQI